MPSPLASIYSASDSLKRKLLDMLTNPVASAQQAIGNANDRAGLLNALTSEAAMEGVDGGPIMGPKSQQLAGMMADAYGPAGVNAWHAGPNLFNRFDVTRAPSTGSAYTRGAYAAASRREALDKYLPRTGEKYESVLRDMYKAAEKNRDYNSMEVLESAMLSRLPSELRNQFVKSGEYSPEFAQNAERIIGGLERIPRDSYLYKLDIADEALPNYMLFDRPMTQQPAAVQQYAKEVGAFGDDMLGGDIVGKLRASGVPEMQIQEGFKSRGIPGLIYNSPDVPGSVNYVNYDPDLVKILEINDTPAASLFDMLGMKKRKIR